MELIGTLTSPFVRRVRVVCTELNVPFNLTLSTTPDGDRLLRQMNPIWKVPVAEIDGQVVFDSHAIIAELVRRHGWGSLQAPPAGDADRLRDGNLLVAIDGVQDAAINVFYLRRDGVAVDSVAYCQKQLERVGSSLSWLAGQLERHSFHGGGGFGLPELALYAALDWIVFREAYPLDAWPALLAFRAAHAQRPSLVETAPH